MLSIIKRHWIFLTLLFVGLIVRVVFSYTQGLSNDELSAWIRVFYSDFSSLMEKGVKVGDMHPAFYQILLWVWVKIFGDGELALRTTSFIFFIFNSILIYRIGRKHFTELSGLLLLALFTGLTFTVMNSAFARPYNSGIFFLLLAFGAILDLKKSNGSKWLNTGLIAIGAAGAMYSHYFAFMTVGIMLFCSLFYVGTTRIKYIIIGGIGALLLFIPHIGITKFHLTRGGLGWLGKPKITWPIDFIYQFFNESWLLAFICIAFIIWLIIRYRKQDRSGTGIFTLSIFIVTFFSAFILSYVFTPILRDVAMMFILPFLFLPILTMISMEKERDKVRAIAFLTLIPLVHGVFIHRLFQPVQFGNFKIAGRLTDEVIRGYGKENITFAVNSNNVEYLNYYVDDSVSETIPDWTEPEAIPSLISRVKTAKTDYFVYVGVHQTNSPQILEIIKDKYPVYIRRYVSKYTTFYLFKKPKYKGNVLTDLKSSTEEFFGEIRYNVKDLEEFNGPEDYYLVEAPVETDSNTNLILVATIERDGSLYDDKKEPYLYIGPSQSTLNPEGGKSRLYSAFVLPENIRKSDILRMYYWNPDKKEVKCGELKFRRVD